MAAKRNDETERFLSAWMQVRQMVQAANFNRFHREGLSATQFMALNVLPREGSTLSELARRLNLSAATLNETVNSLEERGLVERRRNVNDARKVDIRATRTGQTMQNAASSEFHGWLAGMFANMSARERDGLLAGLEKMVLLGAETGETTRRDDGALRATRSSRESRPVSRESRSPKK